MESIPPFAIIVGAITAMGGLQYLVHGAAYDKPRAIGLDAFDRLVQARDEARAARGDGRRWIPAHVMGEDGRGGDVDAGVMTRRTNARRRRGSACN